MPMLEFFYPYDIYRKSWIEAAQVRDMFFNGVSGAGGHAGLYVCKYRLTQRFREKRLTAFRDMQRIETTIEEAIPLLARLTAFRDMQRIETSESHWLYTTGCPADSLPRHAAD